MSVTFITGSLADLRIPRMAGDCGCPSWRSASQNGTSGLSLKCGYTLPGCRCSKFAMPYSIFSSLRCSFMRVSVMGMPLGRRNSYSLDAFSTRNAVRSMHVSAPVTASSSHSRFMASFRVSIRCPRVLKTGLSTCSMPMVLNSRSGLTTAFIGNSPAKARAAWWSASARSRTWPMTHVRGCVQWFGRGGSSTGAQMAARRAAKSLPEALASAKRLNSNAVFVQ
mmetsp:Transcript_2861/g.8524  ORF Transcript_2861/g.8524 Transcript_2861/m.8524 type:complete len:223 (-) Transcript_2861:585-1253(-)